MILASHTRHILDMSCSGTTMMCCPFSAVAVLANTTVADQKSLYGPWHVKKKLPELELPSQIPEAKLLHYMFKAKAHKLKFLSNNSQLTISSST